MMRRAAPLGLATAISLLGLTLASTAPAHLPGAHAASLTYWAAVDNPFPYVNPNRTVTVTGHFLADGQAAPGVKMSTVWRNDGRIQFCYSKTDLGGMALCTRRLGAAGVGSTIQITVTFSYQGSQYSTSTAAIVH